jgi:hypothetical protein
VRNIEVFWTNNKVFITCVHWFHTHSNHQFECESQVTPRCCRWTYSAEAPVIKTTESEILLAMKFSSNANSA